MKYDRAKRADLPALTQLWFNSFGDSIEEIKNFWSASFDRIQVYVAREGKQPVAMLSVLPAELTDPEGEAHSCGYFYAVCTDPDWRGKGICSALMQYAQSHCGYEYAALVPAVDSLFSFYERLGYKTAFTLRRYEVLPKKGAKIQPASPEVYRSIRELQLYDSFLSYDEFLLPFAGSLYRIETQDGLYCACAQKDREALLIRELLPDSPEAAAALCAHLGCEKAYVRTLGDEEDFGMLLPLANAPLLTRAYLGLAFD